MKNTSLPPHLEAAQQEIEGYAREYGLDFYPIIYEVLNYRTLYETASLGGFPIRYPHWRFGMEYDQLIKGHVWLGSTIYEMIINTNPAYGYLLEGNEDVTQRMVMAHVCAHVDFFKNNMWFAHTNRKMLDEMANHASRIQTIIERQGYDVVEDFIDTCLSLDNLIDYHAPYIKRPEMQIVEPLVENSSNEDGQKFEGLQVEREYMREYINPPDFLDQQRKQAEQERVQQKRFPANPQKDILLFLLNHAPLERWQHTILNIIRDEAYYFAPQGMTKILNEGWACLVADSLLYTDQGLLRIGDIARNRAAVQVSDGETLQRVYDWAIFNDRQTVRLRTRRGLELEGSVTHGVLLPDGSWRRLDELHTGESLRLSAGPNLWAHDYVTLERLPEVLHAQAGQPGSSRSAVLEPFTDDYDPAVATATVLDEAMAALLGSLCSSRHPGFSVVDAEVEPLLAQPGLQVGTAPHSKDVPELILQSPQTVVAAFLRALYDGDGDVDESGIVLATSSAKMSKAVQLLLLNFGILASRQAHAATNWHLRITGPSASLFQAEIGFGLPHKQAALQHYLSAGQWSEHEDWNDEIVALDYGRAPVYDISVETTHRYAAQGFINHNSYWHSQIMTRRALRDSEVIQFADLHSGVVATSGGRLNPYKVGLELLRDVEDRWNRGRFGKEYDECDDIAAKRNWDKELGLGRQKIFEIRRLYNDVTFIDEFMTPEFVIEHKLFSFKYNRDTDFYEIASREFQEVKEKLLFQLTNFGQPFIYLEDANYNNRAELYLKHRHEGVDLQMNYARDTLRNLYKLWTRPVYVETIIDDRKRLLCFDGSDFSERRID